MINKIVNGFKTAAQGLSLTLKHLFSGNSRRKVVSVTDNNYFKLQEDTTTIQYPKQQLPIPEVGRYQLDVEIDDCIVCDLCAKICPVNCIDIESIKSTQGTIGETSDGSKKLLYAAKFDIDMAKCMYCGLCTIVCPTECITMTNQYDRTVFDLGQLTYQFSDMSPEEADEKRRLLEQQQAEKQAAKQAAMKAKGGSA
ncbi:NADH-quinone oxidoreductase subunit I [Mucilaginibacter terrenus]|uniref:NADH-quinone oxidoreductase subunit I n=1 Tax=Mucilaginibacter terrenus TaxID=2482727 RepID=A0A3E2NXA5_9SPHI|nr:NADH-quinone oxidoreductase subunit I [Mucilaginibacter terrenus]RFZ85656.1 NADH-quinone oxidoreductase subunit I [Mucilaginibacter terrenus]